MLYSAAMLLMKTRRARPSRFSAGASASVRRSTASTLMALFGTKSGSALVVLPPTHHNLHHAVVLGVIQFDGDAPLVLR